VEAAYEIFDHTADMGFRVVAQTLQGLIEPAGEALYSIIGELVVVGTAEPHTFDLTGRTSAELLRDYLAELLILFERQDRKVTGVNIECFDEQRLTVAVETKLVDRERSTLAHEVKAITYHELDIRPIDGGYQASIIVDI